MTNQSQPGQQNQAPGQKPGQQQGGGQKLGQQSQSPGKGDKNPKEPYDQRRTATPNQRSGSLRWAGSFSITNLAIQKETKAE